MRTSLKPTLRPATQKGIINRSYGEKTTATSHRAFVVGGHSINARDPKLAKQFFGKYGQSERDRFAATCGEREFV
ncbi:hypothetical protein O9992_00630 [Vibrio lentus]|nr:hypothetical protein [Vibrio lentus]